MRLKFTCRNCGREGLAEFSHKSAAEFIHAPWYTDSEGLQHNCIYCRSCGTVHDTIGSLLGPIKLLLKRVASDIVTTYEISDYVDLIKSKADPLFASLHAYILIAMEQDGRIKQLFAPHFFHIPLATDLMGKSVNQILDKCVDFNPQLLPASDPGFDTFAKEHPELFNAENKLPLFDTSVGFHCYFEIEDYQAFCFVGVNFVNSMAIECIVNLGKPINLERYSREYKVLRTITRSMERAYHNGRAQYNSKRGRVFTWKKDSSLVSLISYPPSGPDGTGVYLSIQIRDIRLHPGGRELELLYSDAKKLS